MQTGSEKLVDRIRRSARETNQEWPEQKPPFAVRTGWSQSYDDVLSGVFGMILGESDILNRPLAAGRAILSGRGGDGKTWLLRRLHERALATGAVPVFVDLKRWTGADYSNWSEWTRDNVGNGADFIIRRFSGLELGAIDLDRLPPDTRKIIFVDGLNEISAKVGLEILSVLDEIVANQINMSVIVADRLVRRELPNSARWWIGSPLPLTLDEIRKHLGKNVVLTSDDIRTSPFFLDAELRTGPAGGRRAATLVRLVQAHGGLSEAEVFLISNAAFSAYRESRSRMFERTAFEEAVGDALVAKLEQSGTVRFNEAGGFFHHHIVHDFLAARYVSGLDTNAWTSELFRALSFDASSFDAVELAFEQLDRDRADLFLQKLYDWNLYAAGYALAQTREADDVVGTEMRTVIFAMLADKCFDPVLATRQRAGDALRLMQLAAVEPFRRAGNIGDVCAAVQVVNSDSHWFNDWKELFSLAETGAISAAALEKITQADSIMGWTVANVAKRVKDGGWMIPVLTQWLKQDFNATVRWRIAHVLGALPVAPALEQLLRLLDEDDDEDVKYGAVRSVVELATISDPQLRALAGDAIQQRAATISDSDRLSRELRSSLLIDPAVAPPDWLDFVRDCVRSQFMATDKLGDRDLWRGCLNRAERLYMPAAASAEM